jgi:hypothetical protein
MSVASNNPIFAATAGQVINVAAFQDTGGALSTSGTSPGQSILCVRHLL